MVINAIVDEEDPAFNKIWMVFFTFPSDSNYNILHTGQYWKSIDKINLKLF
jgi:hypothetical protein